MPGVAVGVPVGVPGVLVGVPGSGRPRTGGVFAGSLRGVGSGQLEEEEVVLESGEGVRGVTSLRPDGDGVLRPVFVMTSRSCSGARRARISSEPRRWRFLSRPGLGVRAGLAPKGRLGIVVLCAPRAGSWSAEYRSSGYAERGMTPLGAGRLSWRGGGGPPPGGAKEGLGPRGARGLGPREFGGV